MTKRLEGIAHTFEKRLDLFHILLFARGQSSVFICFCAHVLVGLGFTSELNLDFLSSEIVIAPMAMLIPTPKYATEIRTYSY